MSQPFHYGGQAVIEGVMIRGRKTVSVAVRRPEGEVAVFSEPLASALASGPSRWPFLRGLSTLGETLFLGVKALFFSAGLAQTEEPITPAALWSTLASALLLALGLFFFLPLLVVHFLDPYLPSATLSNVIDGALRLVIFLVYLLVLRRFSEVKRVLAYHGAEHKTVNAYENGAPLEVAAVQSYSTGHARCGTAFLLLVLLLALVVFAFLGRPPFWLRLLSRLALLPVIAGVGYEVMRWAANHARFTLVRLLLAPALGLQSLTTAEPDVGQVEVAIAALKEALRKDGEEAELPPPTGPGEEPAIPLSSPEPIENLGPEVRPPVDNGGPGAKTAA